MARAATEHKPARHATHIHPLRGGRTIRNLQPAVKPLDHGLHVRGKDRKIPPKGITITKWYHRGLSKNGPKNAAKVLTLRYFCV